MAACSLAVGLSSAFVVLVNGYDPKVTIAAIPVSYKFSVSKKFAC